MQLEIAGKKKKTAIGYSPKGEEGELFVEHHHCFFGALYPYGTYHPMVIAVIAIDPQKWGYYGKIGICGSL